MILPSNRTSLLEQLLGKYVANNEWYSIQISKKNVRILDQSNELSKLQRELKDAREALIHQREKSRALRREKWEKERARLKEVGDQKDGIPGIEDDRCPICGALAMLGTNGFYCSVDPSHE